MLVTNIITDKSFDAAPGLDLVSSALRRSQPIGHSCRQGVCGSCSASIKSGAYSLIGGSVVNTVAACDPPHKVLLCQVIPHSDMTIQHTPPTATKQYATQIFSIEPLTHDIVRLTLQIISDEPFTFEPGQFIAIRWLGGQLKYFSIANTPGNSAMVELHIRKQFDGGFTQWLFERATTLDLIGIEGPLGSFGWITPPNRPVIMIGTGTGFSPMKSLIEGHRLWEHPAGVRFYWGGRFLADLYQHDLALHWSSIGPKFIYEPVLTKESLDKWSGRSGRIPAAVLQDIPDLSGFDVYACGSPEMIKQAKYMFVTVGGLPEDRFFSDSFESAARSPAKPIVSFDIAFSGSSLRGRIYSEVGVSLLEALKNNCLNLDHYCGGGAVCATCRVNVCSTELSKPEETEADLLDCLVDLTEGDRLACQLYVTASMNNVLVRLPGRPGHISRLEE